MSMSTANQMGAKNDYTPFHIVSVLEGLKARVRVRVDGADVVVGERGDGRLTRAG